MRSRAQTLRIRLAVDTIVDDSTIGFCADTGFERFVNGTSSQQDALVTFNGWQYAVYYKSNRRLALARRQLPGGSWQTFAFAHRLSQDDTHRVAIVGISPGDGKIHLAFDHHNSVLNYLVSRAGLATSPPASWTRSEFLGGPEDVQHFLGSAPNPSIFDQVTYVRFVTTPDDKLQFFWRTGMSGNGQSHLAEYDGNWTYLGQFSYPAGDYVADMNGDGNDDTSANRNAYFNGVTYNYVSKRLHISWTWREETPLYLIANHDLAYAYSDDAGRTWHNGQGAMIARAMEGVRADELIGIGSPGHIAASIAVGRLLMNQEGQTVDSQGRFHVIVSHAPDELYFPIASTQDFHNERQAHARAVHYWRDHDGTWYSTVLPFDNLADRPKIAFDAHDNACVILPRLRIVAASAASNWTDWQIVYDDDRFFGDPVIDTYRLREENVLSVYCQEANDCASPTTVLHVVDLLIGENLAVGKPLTASSEKPENQSGFGPARLSNDGDIETAWVSTAGPTLDQPQWLQIDLNSSHIVTRVEVVSRARYGPRDVVVEVSPDANAHNFVPVASATLPNLQGPHTFSFVPIAAKFVRLVITSSYDPRRPQNPRNVQVAEFRIYGRPLGAKLAVQDVQVDAFQPDHPAGETTDGDLRPESRWSAESVDGRGQRIQYDLGQTRTVGAVAIAWYKGDQRQAYFDIQASNDGSLWRVVYPGGVGSGATRALQVYDFADLQARYVKIVGYGNSGNSWNSITEVNIFAGNAIPDNALPQILSSDSAFPLITASDYQSYGRRPENTNDGRLNTRWSALGDGQWIQYDLGQARTVGSVAIAWYRGDRRQAYFDVRVSSDGLWWRTVYPGGVSSGTTRHLQTVDFPDAQARCVRIVGYGNAQNNWNSITEINVP